MSATSVPGARPPASGITKLVPRLPLSRRVGRRVRGSWPALVWVFAAALAAWLYAIDGGRGRVLAVVEAKLLSVSSTIPSRVERVLVSPGDAVREGQVVAMLDRTDARTRLDVAVAELSRLEADVPARAQEWRIAARRARFDAERLRVDLDLAASDRASDGRGFADDVESVEDRIVVTEAAIARDRAELRQVDAELERMKKLGAEAVSTLTLDVLQARHDGATERIAGNEKRLVLLTGQRKAILGRREAWDALSAAVPLPTAEAAIEADDGVALAPLIAAVRVQEQRVRLVAAEVEALTLRAPADGNVGEVLLHPGELATAGAAVVSIVTSRPGRLVAFVPEGEAAVVQVGEAAAVRPALRSGDAVRARVVGLGASVVEAPLRFRPSPTTPIWGREVYLEAEGAAGLLAGESYRVAFLR